MIVVEWFVPAAWYAANIATKNRNEKAHAGHDDLRSLVGQQEG